MLGEEFAVVTIYIYMRMWPLFGLKWLNTRFGSYLYVKSNLPAMMKPHFEGVLIYEHKIKFRVTFQTHTRNSDRSK